jgi:uncharacterized protein YkwD
MTEESRLRATWWGGAIAVLLAALVAAMVVTAASPLTGEASAASACKAWGKDKPKTLTITQARRAVACLVNRKRRQHGLGALDRDGRLNRSAQRHTRRMRNRGCFSHQCSGERDLVGRLWSVNYLERGLRRWACGENIAWGMRSEGRPANVVRAWMHSPSHRAAILSRTFRDMGIGFVRGTPANNRRFGATYTIDFGLRRG